VAFLDEFKKFAMRGNVVDLAIGFTVGAAFTTIARSLVDDLLMPPVGLVLGRSDFSDFYWLLRADTEAAPPYATLADAQAAGAVTVNYGLFINALLTFLIVALAMFLVIRGINRIDRELERRSGAAEPEPGEPETKKCPFCLATVPFQATRCPQCTSTLEPAPADQARPAAEPPPAPGPPA
jgi:large conductance mechanosensitive channel